MRQIRFRDAGLREKRQEIILLFLSNPESSTISRALVPTLLFGSIPPHVLTAFGLPLLAGVVIRGLAGLVAKHLMLESSKKPFQTVLALK